MSAREKRPKGATPSRVEISTLSIKSEVTPRMAMAKIQRPNAIRCCPAEWRRRKRGREAVLEGVLDLDAKGRSRGHSVWRKYSPFLRFIFLQLCPPVNQWKYIKAKPLPDKQYLPLIPAVLTVPVPLIFH